MLEDVGLCPENRANNSQNKAIHLNTTENYRHVLNCLQSPRQKHGRYNSQVPTRMTHIPKKKRPPSAYFRNGPRSGVQGREHCHATLNPMGFVDVADDFDRHHQIRGMTWAPKPSPRYRGNHKKTHFGGMACPGNQANVGELVFMHMHM